MIRGIYYNVFVKRNSNTYIKYLKKIGMKIGENVNVWSPRRSLIDETRPWLIEIGNNVNITDGVKILTHGYDWSVLKYIDARVYGSAGKVKIGNNVFIGINSIILKGVTIGDNVIIGAGSVVNKNCESNSVYAGNPAKKICSLDEYKERMVMRQEEEAVKTLVEYYNIYNKYPSREVLSEFLWLYTNQEADLTEVEKQQLRNTGNYEESIKNLKNNIPIYKNYNEFVEKNKK